MVIYVLRTFLQSQSFFIVSNQNQMIFILGRTGWREGKLLKFKNLTKLLPRIPKINQITYIFCNSLTYVLIQALPMYWHQEETLGSSVFAEPN